MVQETKERIDTESNLEVTSRTEKKARKALAGLGLEKVNDITRVVLRRPKNVLHVIANPEVFKAPGADTYIVFGEYKVEEQFGAQQMAAAAAAAASANATSTPAVKDAAAEESGDVDETGVDAGNIELVMSQGGVSRARAVQLLKENSNDLINSIMAAASG